MDTAHGVGKARIKKHPPTIQSQEIYRRSQE
jgi:hypothetical protein